MFQFHEGPIKTQEREVPIVRLHLFQFHEGPIKTIGSMYTTVCTLGFNSMKVRLKQPLCKELTFTLKVSIP